MEFFDKNTVLNARRSSLRRVFVVLNPHCTETIHFFNETAGSEGLLHHIRRYAAESCRRVLATASGLCYIAQDFDAFVRTGANLPAPLLPGHFRVW